MSVSRSFHDLHFIAKSLHRFTTVRQRLCCCWYVKSKTHSAARLPRVNYKVFAVCVLCLHIGFCHLYNLHKQQGQLLNGCKKHTHARAHARTHTPFVRIPATTSLLIPAFWKHGSGTYYRFYLMCTRTHSHTYMMMYAACMSRHGTTRVHLRRQCDTWRLHFHLMCTQRNVDDGH